jgi:hypothetical protein
VETNVAAKVAKQIEEAIAERPLMDAAASKEDAKTYPVASWSRSSAAHGLADRAGVCACGAKLPLAGILLMVIAAVYTGDFLYRVVHSTLEGSDTPPDWPKTSEPVEELIKPGVRITSAFLVGHIVWLFVWLNTDSHVGMNPVAEWISYLVAAVYFPFAMMMIVFQERFAACAPWVSLPAMLRCMPGSKVSPHPFRVTAMVAVHGAEEGPLRRRDLLAAGCRAGALHHAQPHGRHDRRAASQGAQPSCIDSNPPWKSNGAGMPRLLGLGPWIA